MPVKRSRPGVLGWMLGEQRDSFRKQPQRWQEGQGLPGARGGGKDAGIWGHWRGSPVIVIVLLVTEIVDGRRWHGTHTHTRTVAV